LIELPSDATAYDVVSTIKRIEMTIPFEFNEGDDLSVLIRYQGAALDHPRGQMSGFGPPEPKHAHLFLRIVFQIYKMDGFIKKTRYGDSIASTLVSDQHFPST
jgi:hypothetical protein